MKALKITGISLLSILCVLYLAFLFVLPNAVNLNNYASDINKTLKEASGLEFSADKIKLQTTWNFHANIMFNKANLKYNSKQELISAETASFGVKLFPLLFKKIELSPIKLQTPKLALIIENDGRYNLEKFLSDLVKKQSQTSTSTEPLPLNLSENMPDIVLENYLITLNDAKTSDMLEIKGKEFKISDFKLNDKIKIATSGDLTLNNQKQVSYNAKVESFLPKITQDTQSTDIQIPQITYNPIPVIKKYNFKTVLDTDLKISEKDNNVLIKGFFNATDLNYKLQGQNIDKSFIKLAFKDNTADINSDLYVDKTEKFTLKGLFKNGKNQSIDLQIVSNKVDLADIQRVLIALCDIANIKNDIASLNVTGYLDSNFNIKSDMKKIKSNGYLKVVNASIKHKILPLTINAVNSNLDFSNNKVNIKDTSALVNGSLFKAEGTIDEKADADVKIYAEKLPLGLLYEAFAPVQTKQTLKITSGTLSLNALLKGRLDKIEPKITLNLNNLKANETAMKLNTSIDSIIADLSANTKGEYKGSAKASSTVLSLDEPAGKISAPLCELDFDTKNITIKPAQINFDNSNFTISGTIKDYASKMNAVIDLNGGFKSSDALKYIPKENRSFVTAQGTMPVVAQITSDGKNTKINAQLLANAQNHLAFLNINSLSGKTSITNLDAQTDGLTFKINDAGLYGLHGLQNNITLSNNFKTNLASSSKIASVEGKITDLNKKTPGLQNVRIHTPAEITATIPGLNNSSIALKADVTANGAASAPEIKGSASISSISIPDYKFTGKNISASFNKDTIIAKSPQINLNGSTLAFDTSISTKIDKYTTINSLNINSEYIDVDKLFQIMDALPQTTVSPGASVPVIIQKGYGNLAKVKSGNITASNATGDFTLKNNLFTLKNIKATAYSGIIAGNASYNIPYETLKAAIQGRGLDSNTAFTAISGLNDQIRGKLDFDADVSMIGSTYEQQMKTLKGTVNFSIGEGQMGSLGRLEHFIYASNLLSQKFAQSSLNTIVQTLAPKNTGQFKHLKGHLTLNNGWAKLEPVYSGGPQMSLYITGQVNLLNNYANLEILGRVAKEIVNVMGSLGDMSVSKLLSNIPKFGSSTSNILNSYNAIKDEATLAKVPALIPASSDTKQFQVVIDGNIEKPTSVRTFKWLASEAEVKEAKTQINTQLQNLIPNKIQEVIKIPSASTNQSSAPSTSTPASQAQNSVETAGKALQEAAKNAAAEQLKKALPSFWDKIE